MGEGGRMNQLKGCEGRCLVEGSAKNNWGSPCRNKSGTLAL